MALPTTLAFGSLRAPRRLLLLALTALALPGTAQASGFQIRENSAQALGRAFAGTAAAPGDLAVVANNPAAMTLLQGRAAQLDVSWIDLSLDFDGAGADALGQPLRGGDGGDAGGLHAVPAAYLFAPFGERWRIGVSLGAPFGLETDYDADWVGRYEAIHSELRVVDVGVALAWQVSDRLALGASLIHQSVEAELSQAVDFGALLGASPLLPPGLFTPQSADGRSTLEGDDRGFGATFGALWRLSSGTRVGLAYRTEIAHTLRGDVDYDVPANVAPLLAAAGVTRFDDTRGRVELTTPAVATVSLHHTASDRLALLADVSYTHWSEFDEIRLRSANGAPDTVDEQGWSDTWFGSLGAEYRVNETLLVRGGIGYDQSPTELEHRSPRVPDRARRWLSLGMSWQASASAVVHVGYARLFARPPSVSTVSVSGSTLAGEIDNRTHLFALSLSYAF
jgi:long-chain fatty acid transport protein